MPPKLSSADLLVIAAAQLSRSARQTEWDDFLGALELHVAQVKDDCIQSPADMLSTAQGRAQQADRYLKLFRECRTLADRIRNNLTNKGPSR